ncbi:hypothetical protein EX530_03920 [Xanthomonas phaseoli]
MDARFQVTQVLVDGHGIALKIGPRRVAQRRGFGIRDSGFGIRDSGFGIRDSGFGIGGWRMADGGWRMAKRIGPRPSPALAGCLQPRRDCLRGSGPARYLRRCRRKSVCTIGTRRPQRRARFVHL